MVMLPFYKDFYNVYCGYPSFGSRPGRESDFFFSGHTGMWLMQYYYWNNLPEQPKAYILKKQI